MCFLLLLAAAALPTRAQLPDFYQSVDRLLWVVEDVDRTMEQLKKLGFTNVTDLGDADLTGVDYRGKPGSGGARLVSGRFADVAVHWIEPYGGENAFAEFLKKHGSGVFSLMHRAPTLEAFQAEVSRLKGLGVGVLQQGTAESSSGTIHYAFFDTEAEGKYVLGLITFPGGDEGPLGVSADNPSGRKVTQYAFAVRQLEPVSKYWARLGWPEMTYTQSKLSDLHYLRKPAHFEMRLGWQRHGKVPYEWILSLKGPDVYLDHMEKHGEGFHHLAFGVEDMDKEVAAWTQLGFPESMSGAWGEKGKPGWGRFTYVDAQALGGTDIELLWSFRR